MYILIIAHSVSNWCENQGVKLYKSVPIFTLVDLFTDDIGITVDVHGAMENLTVGNPYEIQCKVYTDQIVNSDIVDITWIGPDNDPILPDSRLSIITNSIGHNHTSTLLFLHLSEDNEGLFTCNVTILNNIDSESFKVELSSKFHSTVITLWSLTSLT